MPRKRRIGYRITLAQLGLTSDPEFRAAPAEVRREVLGWVLVYGLKAKDAELAAGLDRYGSPLAPISAATRANRKSEMGPADPDAPPLMPAYAVSRTRLLLTGEVRRDGVDYFWEYDPHTGGSWGDILAYHRAGVGKSKRKRDVIGLSPGSRADVRSDTWARWLAWKRMGVSRPFRKEPPPTVPAPRLVTTGKTDYQNFTYGIGTSGAPGPGVQATGFRQRRPGQGWTAFGGPNGPGGRGPKRPPQPPRPPAPAPKPPPPPTPVTVEVRGNPDAGFVRDIEAAAGRLTARVQQTLADKGHRIIVGKRLADVRPELVNTTPRGWPEGLTWDNAEGLYWAVERAAVICQEFKVDGEYRDTGRAVGALFHETGHSFDDALGNVSAVSEKFRQAYDADAAAIPDNMRGRLAYYLQAGAVGRQEAFAEVFAQLHGSGAAGWLRMVEIFPRVADVIRNLIQ